MLLIYELIINAETDQADQTNHMKNCVSAAAPDPVLITAYEESMEGKQDICLEQFRKNCTYLFLKIFTFPFCLI